MMKEVMMKNMQWWLPILLMAMLAPFTPYLDMAISSYFYQGNGQFTNNAFYDFMYNYGIIPGDGMGIVAAIILVLSYFIPKLKKWRSPSLVLVLTIVLGAGLICHALLKDQWGRPRPKQVVQFGGKQEFRPFYEPNFSHQPEPSKSFTCGHCTVGFYFFALALVGKRIGSRTVYILGMILAFGLGIALSLTRIAQGGHFFSDTVMTALIMWLTALTCDWLIYHDSPSTWKVLRK